MCLQLPFKKMFREVDARSHECSVEVCSRLLVQHKRKLVLRILSEA